MVVIEKPKEPEKVIPKEKSLGFDQILSKMEKLGRPIEQKVDEFEEPEEENLVP